MATISVLNTRMGRTVLWLVGIVAFAQSAFAEALPPVFPRDYQDMLATDRTHDIALVRNGNGADNSLGGTEHGDVFFGAEGNDLLIGYQGRDRYSFAPQSGLDTIVDHSVEGNIIHFRPGVVESDVTVEAIAGRDGETDRLIRYGETDAIRIVGWSELSEATQASWSFEYTAPPPRREGNAPRNPVTEFMEVFSTVWAPLLALLVLALLAIAKQLRTPRR